MTDYTKQMQEMASAFTDQLKMTMPKVTFNKNGYEIRAQVLELAQSQVWQDYHTKWGQFETSVSKEGSQFVTKVEMPAVPGTDQVLEAAKKFYEFVNGGVK
jgi:hypothetical protein